ncbi:hypothetical protein IV73_GL000636 [Weissella kandleri]|uniref:IrrE N-terminal-like domain-containing protein n=1 Tax=Weissella kandleri TaxID=1616 RepID=A0A0R2JDS1_9LACO|nr:hypothetical protein [Weissella kandleri]KRN75467.1 hypothetical protein IV73_GL000636 [Weissella kandleri]
MNSLEYDELLIRVENDLIKHHLQPVILDTVPLYDETKLDGVTFIKGGRCFIIIDKTLDYFRKSKTLVEEYFHAISDLGNHLDYDEIRAQNDEVDARDSIIEYLADEDVILHLAHKYSDQPFESWILMDELGYDLDFAEQTIDHYRQRGIIS